MGPILARPLGEYPLSFLGTCLLEQKQDPCKETQKNEKKDLTIKIVRLYQERCRRFLNQDGWRWVEVDFDAVALQESEFMLPYFTEEKKMNRRRENSNRTPDQALSDH
jgi:hypothetical protein